MESWTRQAYLGAQCRRVAGNLQQDFVSLSW